MTGLRRPESLPQVLRRRFDLIIFDWDGTAVPDRYTPTPELNRALETLLLQGVWIAPVTGTKVENLETHSLSMLSPQARASGLIVCTNRGSEVWAYDPDGSRRKVWARVSTEDEERHLSAAAEVLQHRLRERGLETEIIYQRLNRRKVDLIPLPEWADPPKARIADLIAATRARVRAAGFAEIADVMDLAGDLARDAGLRDPRITSDGKYVEIGLTDKGDSVVWLLENVARPNGIANENILVAGDEFGDVGGFSGSDARMLVPQAEHAVFVSVGPEPAGVPHPIFKVGGGPQRFVEILEWQSTLHGG
jgi:hydroxymethylpyrimidine pyrophosphatase-like HAD family hydrolase